MAELGNIFLCHAKSDKARVRELYHRLRDMGLAPWLDDEDLRPGQEWREEIEKAIRRADYFLACLSRKSVDKRGFVQAEIRIALDVVNEMPEGQVFLIPVRLEDCDVPLSLSKHQWVDLFDRDAGRGFLRLLWAIGLEQPEYAHRLPVFGREQRATPLGVRDAVDYSALRRALSAENWMDASDETHSILVYLAGHRAATERQIQTPVHAAHISCSHLHTIRRLWDDYGSEGLELRYPRIYIPRDSNVENGMLGEMNLINQRFRDCGIEPFIWFMRSGYSHSDDSEVSYGPRLASTLRSLAEDSSPEYELLCYSSFFASWYPIPFALVLSGSSALGTRLSEALGQSDSCGRLDQFLGSLAKRSLIYDYSRGKSYKVGTYASGLAKKSMEVDGTGALWLDRTFVAINEAIPLPSSSAWPPNSDVAYQAERVLEWYDDKADGISSEVIATICLKLAAYDIEFSDHGGWERSADEKLTRAHDLLGDDHSLSGTIHEQRDKLPIDESRG